MAKKNVLPNTAEIMPRVWMQRILDAKNKEEMKRIFDQVPDDHKKLVKKHITIMKEKLAFAAKN